MVGQASSDTHTQEHLPPGTHRPMPALCMRGENIRLTGLILQSNLRLPAADYSGQGENCAFLHYYAASSSKVALTTTLPLPPTTRTNPMAENTLFRTFHRPTVPYINPVRG